jgi:hypothetical protein
MKKARCTAPGFWLSAGPEKSGLAGSGERPCGLRVQRGLRCGCRGRLGGRLFRGGFFGGRGGFFGGRLFGCSGLLGRRGFLRRRSGLLHRSCRLFGRSCLLRRSRRLLGRSCLLRRSRRLLGRSCLLRRRCRLLGRSCLLRRCCRLLGRSCLLRRCCRLLGRSCLLRRRCRLLGRGRFLRGRCRLLGRSRLLRRCGFLCRSFFRSCHVVLLDQVAQCTTHPRMDVQRFSELGAGGCMPLVVPSALNGETKPARGQCAAWWSGFENEGRM